ncbi:hypothetical protein Bca4012_035139 [Brassica carinata]
MTSRYTRMEKGKWQAPPGVPLKKPPVRIPANDNEDLIEANRLTIIGRLTNTLIQKPRAVIDFMAQVWNLEGRVSGRPLGLDKFQVKFETEHDLLQVLEKGPYHYKRWMLLLQRWEPTVSDQFPSKISFNVRIHGIPLHFWSGKTILTIGAELGNCVIRDEKEAKIWVEVDGLEPLVMKMEIELPSGDITEVEFEYIKIEKHCFTCFSLFHEEANCPHRSANAPPPKERNLGITQSIALQRIEAEKKRHDDKRGYSRPTDSRPTVRSTDDSHLPPRRDGNRAGASRYHAQRENHYREHSILSRTARSNASYGNKAPSLQYRVVERSRHSSGSYTPQQNSEARGHPDIRDTAPNTGNRVPPATAILETSPTRTLKERLGPTNDQLPLNSGSKERRSALERLSEPRSTSGPAARRTPSFDAGRLQLDESRMEFTIEAERDKGVETATADRVPATQRLGSPSSKIESRRGAIPVATSSKGVTKRRVTKNQKRVVRSPVLVPSLKKQPVARSTTSTKRRLAVDNDNILPCDKAGNSKAGPSLQRKKNGQPTTVFIPGVTRGGADFRPHQSSLP